MLSIASTLYILNLYYDNKDYYLGSELHPEKLNFSSELFNPNLTGYNDNSIYLAVYFGEEWNRYAKRANSLFIKNISFEQDFECVDILRFVKKKLVLNKGQSQSEICPGLSFEIINYLKNKDWSDYELGFYNKRKINKNLI